MRKIVVVWALLCISLVSFAQEGKPGVHIYNPEANAKADLKAAAKRALKNKKHVFVQVGGNWCVWCIAFHNLIEETPALKNYLNENFEVVNVNYSKEQKNAAVLASLGYPQRFGYPVFVILNGKGKVLHIQNSEYLETTALDANGKQKEGHSVDKIMNFLKGWTYKAVDPASYQ